MFALVDDDVFWELAEFRWGMLHPKPKLFYAARIRRIDEEPGPRTIMMHRFISKAPKHLIVDHIDGNGLNNQRSNLRLCTHAQNAQNQRLRVNNKTGFKGISLRLRPGHQPVWEAKIVSKGTTLHLGHFKTPEDAARAYNKAALELHGPFAKINPHI